MPDITKINKSLLHHNIAPSIIQQIMDGEQSISPKSAKAQKAEFIRQVIARIDALLDADTRHAVIDWCACCKGGSRDKNVKAFAKQNKEKSLSEKIEGLSQVQWMGRPVLNEDGTISTGIYWVDETSGYRCPCPCFIGLEFKEPISITYCHCCAGHFRHHYQNALNIKLKTKEVTSSVLASMGRKPCQFIYEVVD